MNWPHLLHWKSQKCKKMAAWDKLSLPCFFSFWNPKKIQTLPHFYAPILFYVDFLTCIPFKKFEIQTESCESMLWKSRPHAEEKQQCSAIFYFGKWGLSTMFGGASIFFSLKWPPHVEISATFNCWLSSNLKSPSIVKTKKYILELIWHAP